LALTKGLTLETRIGVETATFDAEQIRRALDNLVLNAIEAAPLHSKIVISAEPNGDKLRLAVRDEGAGPPPEIRDHLFEPFVTGRPEGTGLGLSLVREIANAHGGTANLITAADGTTFEMVIPWH
jgi:signal transduction histidine kinase